MSKEARHITRRSTLIGYSSILIALVIVLLITAWGARRAVSAMRRTFLATEITRLRSHATRTVGRVENLLENQDGGPNLDAIRQVPWVRDFWRRVVPRERQRLYAAFVDDRGVVLMHSDPEQEPRRLEPRWFEHVVADVGEDVVATRSDVLTGGQLAYDIRVPIEVRDNEVGAYHSGFDAAWFEEAVEQRRIGIYRRWAAAGGCIVLVVLVAGASLFRLARHATALEQAVAMSRTQRVTELGKLVGGLAHEIRNPLNAIRLNLSTIRRSLQKGDGRSAAESAHLIDESDAEIERLENLVRSVLSYGQPEQSDVENLDLGRETRAALEFLEQLLGRDDIKVQADIPESPIIVAIDRSRLRQIMLNLLNNAREATERNGQIDVVLRHRENWADLCIADTGPGIPHAERERVFDPFYTTKNSGYGLGLSLVRRFVEEAGGAVVCESNDRHGAKFRISLPEISSDRGKRAS